MIYEKSNSDAPVTFDIASNIFYIESSIRYVDDNFSVYTKMSYNWM